jgi:hypothetical protein
MQDNAHYCSMRLMGGCAFRKECVRIVSIAETSVSLNLHGVRSLNKSRELLWEVDKLEVSAI